MSTFSMIQYASIAALVLGFMIYSREIYLDRVDLRTLWNELNATQWTAVGLIFVGGLGFIGSLLVMSALH